MPIQALAYMGVFLIWLLSWCLALWGCWGLLKRLGAKARPLFSDDLLSVLLGLLLSLLLFRDVASLLLSEMARFALAPLNVEVQQSRQETGALTALAQLLATILIALGRNMPRAVQEFLRSGTLERAVLLLCTWALASHLLSRLSRLAAGRLPPPGQPAELAQALRRLLPGPAAAKDIAFMLVLALGVFLSLGAICAIPLLQDPPALEGVSGEKLRQRLQDSLTDEQFDRLYPSSLDEQIYDELGRRPARPQRAGGGQADGGADRPDGGAARVESNAGLLGEKDIDQEPARLGALRELRRQRWDTLRSFTRECQRKALRDASDSFELASLEPHGGRQQARHVASIHAWYLRRLGHLNPQLDRCLGAIRALDQAVREAAPRQGPSPAADPLGSDASELLREEADRRAARQQAADDMARACEPRGEESAAPRDNPILPPPPPLPGEDLSPIFLWLARWILINQSLALALIVGMLGFGLLGAAGSTFVRERSRRQPGAAGGSIVEDLAGVIIRGTSAAVILFLGVEGGLGVFTSGTGTPNPYVLLFACLVAAVFSEDVWDWAHRRLRDGLGDGEGKRAGAGGVASGQAGGAAGGTAPPKPDAGGTGDAPK